MIKQFQNEYRWLSNFTPVKIRVGNLTYPSVEHAYMAAKSNERKWKETCATGGFTAGRVKRLSREITLCDNWEEVKLKVMEGLLRAKFNQEPFKTLLINTGEQHIQEGNMWNDKFWGICLKTNKGQNHLGKLIMQIRDELNNKE
jgi:hypothetical protein